MQDAVERDQDVSELYRSRERSLERSASYHVLEHRSVRRPGSWVRTIAVCYIWSFSGMF